VAIHFPPGNKIGVPFSLSSTQASTEQPEVTLWDLSLSERGDFGITYYVSSFKFVHAIELIMGPCIISQRGMPTVQVRLTFA
jgi:hypothetical protein